MLKGALAGCSGLTARTVCVIICGMVQTVMAEATGGRVNLQLPVDLWKWLSFKAYENDRSRNKQVVAYLREIQKSEERGEAT